VGKILVLPEERQREIYIASRDGQTQDLPHVWVLVPVLTQLSGKQRKVNVLLGRYAVQTIVISLKNPVEDLQASELHRRTAETIFIITYFTE